MLAKGCHLGGNTWREIPKKSSSVISNVPRKRCFDELNYQVGFSTDWRYHPEMVYNRNCIRRKIFDIIQNEKFAPMLEILLLSDAASKEEYMNLETLNQRVQALLGVKSYNTGYYGVPEEAGLSEPSIAHGLPCLPDHGSSIPRLTDMDVLHNLPASYGGSNLDANTRSTSDYFPQQNLNNLEMDLTEYRDFVPTTMGKPLQSEDSTFMFSQSASVNTSEFSNNFPDLWSYIDFSEYQPQKLDIQNNFTHDGNTEPMLLHSKRRKMMESGCDVSLVNNASYDQPIHELIPSKGYGVSSANYPSFDERNYGMVQPYSFQTLPEVHQQPEFPLSSIYYGNNVEQFPPSVEVNSLAELVNNDDGNNVQQFPLTVKVNSVAELVNIDEEDSHKKIGFNHEGTDAKEKVSEPKADQEMQTKSTNTIVDAVSLIDLFTLDQITEHISSLRKESVQMISEDEAGIDANTCELCERKKLYFAPVPIYCLCCGIRIKRTYFCRREEIEAQGCICSVCYNTSKGGKITFNGTSISKTDLEKRNNNEVLEEPWVECTKCKRWQHQICALYNNKRDYDCSAEYICPVCHLKELENGMHVPLPKAANFGAKDLPRTMLSDHLEKRLFESLLQERENWEKVDKVLAAESLSIREVLSADKQLKVNKLFLDIIPEENYPAEFSYRSRVILLFQQIEGVDVCIFGMYVQEFGSECGNPNQRCVYISYLDSVKYFRPERRTKSGEALRTFVYHEILIGYLDFVKKRGFSTCYIWACAPSKKGDDYILYCHPKEQKTPKNDKLRSWYLSMIKKATEENIVVGLTNVYDHFFASSEKGNSKVTASRLPYFDGDCWCGNAMQVAKNFEKESRGDFEKLLKQVSNRTLKTMGHANPSKDILVMQKVGQNILPTKENFLIAHLQYSCMHCREVIVSGKRWFCTKCKKFQECERCHSIDEHTSKNGEVHTLCQAVVDDIPSNTKHNDIVLESGLFENRDSFLIFCQKSQFQFDTLRRAKYSSMMILYHLHNPTAMTVGKCCSICSAPNVFQKCWKCEICPDYTICSACYKDRGADCHEHKLTQHEHQLTENEHQLTEHEHQLTENEHQLTENEHQLTEHEHQLTENEHQLTQNEHQLTQNEHQLTQNEHQLTEHEHQLTENEHQLTEHEHQLTENEHQLTEHEHQLTENEHQLTENEHQLTQNCSTPVCESGNQESNEEMMVKLLNVLKHASQCRAPNAEPCSHPNCSQIKKLFFHASKCKIRVKQGCQHCKKIWFILTAHSRNCKDSECRIPRCSDLKKLIAQRSMHSESCRRAEASESDGAVIGQ